MNESEKEIMMEILNNQKRYFSMMTEETREELSEFSKMIQTQIKGIISGLSGLQDPIKNVTEDLLKSMTETGGALKEYEEQIKEVNKLNQSEETKAQAMFKFYDIIEKIQEKLEKMSPEEKNKPENDFLKRLEDSFRPIKEAVEKIKEKNKTEDLYNKTMKKIGSSKRSSMDDMFKSLNIDFALNPNNINPYAAILELSKKNQEAGIAALRDFHKMVFNIYDEYLNPTNMMFSLATNIKKYTIEMIKRLDEVSAEFMKTTGLGEKYNDMIEDGWRNNLTFNITMHDMSASFQSLIDTMRGFSTLAEKQKLQIAEYTALLGRLGVGSENVSKMFSFFMDTLGQTETQAESSIGKIMGLTHTTGDSLKKISSEFESAFKVLSKYSNQTTRVFKQLYATAKSLKIEIGSLIAVTEGFDSYETAATNVGRLNAILGGPYLNTIQLMKAEEDERIQMLNQAFQATGKNWQSLHRYERQAIAAAAGISDLNDAEKILSGSLSDVNKYLRERNLTQKELEERNKRAATLSERWANIMSSLAVAIEPVLTVLHFVVDKIAWMVEKLDGLGVIISFFVVSGLWKLVRGIQDKAIPALFGLVKGIFKTKEATEQLQKPVEKAADVLTDVGKTAPVTKVAGTSLTMFSDALFKAAPKIAGAILMIGGAIALVGAAFFGLKSLFEGLGNIFSGIGDMFSGLGDTMSAAAEGISSFAFSARTDAVAKFFKNISETSTDPIMKINQLSESIINLSHTLLKIPASNLSKFSDFFEELSDLANESANDTSVKFMNSLAGFMDSTLKITPEKITNVEKITKNITEMSKEISRGNNVEEVLDKLVKILNPSQDKSKQGGGTIQIYIGDELKYEKTGANINVFGNSRIGK